MSEATTKALTDAIYDRWDESGKGQELDNEQLYDMAREAALTIEAAGTTKAIIRAWLASIDVTAQDMVDVFEAIPGTREAAEDTALQMAEAIREVSS